MRDSRGRHGFRKPPAMSGLILPRARDFSVLSIDVSQRLDDVLASFDPGCELWKCDGGRQTFGTCPRHDLNGGGHLVQDLPLLLARQSELSRIPLKFRGFFPQALTRLPQLGQFRCVHDTGGRCVVVVLQPFLEVFGRGGIECRAMSLPRLIP